MAKKKVLFSDRAAYLAIPLSWGKVCEIWNPEGDRTECLLLSLGEVRLALEYWTLTQEEYWTFTQEEAH